MPPPRPATEACRGSLEPGQPSRARSANTHYAAGRPHTPPADQMFATDIRQTDIRWTDGKCQTASLLNAPWVGHNNVGRKPAEFAQQDSNLIYESRSLMLSGYPNVYPHITYACRRPSMWS